MNGQAPPQRYRRWMDRWSRSARDRPWHEAAASAESIRCREAWKPAGATGTTAQQKPLRVAVRFALLGSRHAVWVDWSMHVCRGMQHSHCR